MKLTKNTNAYNMTVKDVIEAVDEGKIMIGLYKNSIDIQRKDVWSRNKKSYLINSICIDKDGYIPPLTLIKKENYFMIADGKQRILSIYNFVKGLYKLDTTGVVFNGNQYKNKYFKDLPDDVKEFILNYKIVVMIELYRTDEQCANIFRLLNIDNGLKAMEKWRAELGDMLPFINSISEYKCFSKLYYTDTQLLHYGNIETALDFLMEEIDEGCDHNKKTKTKFVKSNSKYAGFSQQTKDSIDMKLNYLDKALELCTSSELKKITKSSNDKILIYRILNLAIDTLSANDFSGFLKYYFLNENNSYTKIVGTTSTSNKSSLNKRFTHMNKELNKYIRKIAKNK